MSRLGDEATIHLKAFDAFVGRMQQKVAEDVVEHGVPHGDRYVTVSDVRDKLVEIAKLCFEVIHHNSPVSTSTCSTY